MRVIQENILVRSKTLQVDATDMMVVDTSFVARHERYHKEHYSELYIGATNFRNFFGEGPCSRGSRGIDEVNRAL